MTDSIRRRPVLRSRLARVLVLGAGLTLAATSALPVQTGAAPIDDKRAQAAKLEADINANAEKLAVLNEQIKAVQDQLDQANATIADAQSRIVAAQNDVARITGLVRERAATIYKQASGGGNIAEFDIDIREIASRRKYADAANQRDSLLLDQLARAKEELAARQREAESVKQAADAKKQQLDASKAEFEATNAEYQRLYSQVKGEIAQLVAQAEAARRAAQAPKPAPTSTRSGTGSGFDPSTVPPASGRAGTVVAYAQAQLGKPYCYAGVGPDCYDCSGLTMMAWAQVGVGMAHNSEAQIASFPNVPMSQVAPGDIVWFPGHVGIYVGGGAVVNATHTGDVVRYHDLGMYSRAARPG